MQIMKKSVVYIKVCDLDGDNNGQLLLIFMDPSIQNKSYKPTNTKRNKTEKKQTIGFCLPPEQFLKLVG